MPDFLQADKLSLFLFFALPGLIGVYTWDLLIPVPERKAPEQLLRGVTFSIVNSVLIWPIAAAAAPSVAPTLARVATGFVLLVLPVLEAVGLRALLASRWVRAFGGLRHPVPTPWDHFFGRGETCWLVMHLKSGRKVAGYFGMDSFASDFPRPEQIYVQQTWVLDENDYTRFDHAVPRSQGAIISMADCESVEFFTDQPEGK